VSIELVIRADDTTTAEERERAIAAISSFVGNATQATALVAVGPHHAELLAEARRQAELTYGGPLLRAVAEMTLAGDATTGLTVQAKLGKRTGGMMLSLNTYYAKFGEKNRLVSNAYRAKDAFPTYEMSPAVARAIVEGLSASGTPA